MHSLDEIVEMNKDSDKVKQISNAKYLRGEVNRLNNVIAERDFTIGELRNHNTVLKTTSVTKHNQVKNVLSELISENEILLLWQDRANKEFDSLETENKSLRAALTEIAEQDLELWRVKEIAKNVISDDELKVGL